MGLFGGRFTPEPLVYAKALHWKGDNIQAMEALQRVTQVKPHSFDAWYALGALLEMQRQTAAAIGAYNKAIAINDMNPQVYLKKAFLLNAQGQYEAALEACNIATAIDLNSTAAWNLKGSILDDLKRFDDALGAYERTLLLDPEMVDCWSNKGVTLRKMRRLDEAKDALEHAIALNGSFIPAYINLANVLLDQNQGDAALAEADKAITLDATNPVIWFTRGRALSNLRRYPEALEALQRCPNIPQARALRAAVEQAIQG
jgi:tetratricopeptide (TPR) repeat protein